MIYDVVYSGVDVTGDYSIITGNYIYTCGYGIRVWSGVDGIITDNFIKNPGSSGIAFEDNTVARFIVMQNKQRDGARAIWVKTGSSLHVISDNYWIFVSNPVVLIDGSVTFLGRNTGYVTEKSGTATILTATTSIYIPHGCSYTPTAKDISYVFTENPTNAITYQYVGNLTATGFTIYTNDPGASNLDLSWNIQRTP